MQTQQKPKSAEEGYELVRKLIFHQVHKFVRAYGGDFDELVADANEMFVMGHAQFERGTTNTGLPIENSYATHIRYWVWLGLFDKMRLKLTRNHKAPCVSLAVDMHDQAVEDVGYRVPEFLDELTDDGRFVAGLVLEPSAKIVEVAEAKGGTPCNYRSTIREYLFEIGWKQDRIRDAFEDIKHVVG